MRICQKNDMWYNEGVISKEEAAMPRDATRKNHEEATFDDTVLHPDPCWFLGMRGTRIRSGQGSGAEVASFEADTVGCRFRQNT